MATRRTAVARIRRIAHRPPPAAARAASLVHVADDDPGITRAGEPGAFTYRHAGGRAVRDRRTLDRIASLGIPPAWTDVWICPQPDGHLQATGRDARRRKQYRYHPAWRQVRDETKYGRMLLFGEALPALRERVDAALDAPGMPRDKLLAIVVRLLETTFIRVGNEEYVRQNGSYGLTTLRDHHVDIRGAKLAFRFRGKGGKRHAIVVTDRRLARLVAHCRDLPGQELFQYVDDDGRPQPITSADVNGYLREVTGQGFTAKDFRTWAGTLLAARHLRQGEVSRPADVIREVAAQLGNTPTVCRKCYIHPAVLEALADEARRARWLDACRGGCRRGLTPEESSLLRYLAA